MTSRATKKHRIKDALVDTTWWAQTYKALQNTPKNEIGLEKNSRTRVIEEMHTNVLLRKVLFKLFVGADAISSQMGLDQAGHVLEIYHEYGRNKLRDNFAGKTREENPSWYPAMFGIWRTHVNICRERIQKRKNV